MRRALVIGVDHYDNCGALYGCVNDAHQVANVIDRHGDGTVNFSVKLMTATGPNAPLDRKTIRSNLQELFSGDPEAAFFYFAGHGHVESAGGYLLASDAESGDDGIALAELLHFANESKARNKIIVLDSCHSGVMGKPTATASTSELSEGVTILTASTEEQYATEENGSGVFTSLFVDALKGSASNLVGDISPGGIYAHIDQSLGPWEQRPVFKTNVKSFVSLRKVSPPIDLEDLRRIIEFFPDPGHQMPLDPSFEPENDKADPTNNEIFAVLQKMRDVGLVRPVGTSHMYHAAITSKSCELTVLGEHYQRLVKKGRI